MVELADLWLPILLSAVGVFVVSSILHMVIPIHKSDYAPLPNEAEVLAAMRDKGVGPGAYMFPCPKSMQDMASPEMTEKYNAGPVGFMTVKRNGPPSMGPSLVMWFLFSIVISFVCAYVSTFTSLVRGTDYMMVFRLIATVSFLGYGLADVPTSIWKGQKWGTTAKFIFDGFVYSLVTAGVFGWLWPEAL